jgi:hypothetical protein
MKRIEIEVAPWVELPERENKPITFTEWVEKKMTPYLDGCGYWVMAPELLNEKVEKYLEYCDQFEEKPSEILKEVFFRDNAVGDTDFKTWSEVQKVVYLGWCASDGDLFLVEDITHTTICQGILNDLFIYVNE